MDYELKKFIEIIKTGSPQEVKEAQRQIEKYWHNVYIPQRERGKKAFLIFLDEIKKLEEIKDIDHQYYLVNTLKWPMWVLGEEYFEEWAPFILKYIQHPSGKIRQAIIHASEYLILDLTMDTRFDIDDNNKKITDNDRKRIEQNKFRFGAFVLTAEQLLDKYYEPKFERYKYINSMPAGIYKSLQKMIVENLLRSEHYEKLYKNFLEEYMPQFRRNQINLNQQQIIKKRGEIEKELLYFLRKTKSDFCLDDIKEIIYNEESQDDLTKIIAMFDTGQGLIELENILETVNDAWNYFPHKILGGISPAEKLLEHQSNTNEIKSD